LPASSGADRVPGPGPVPGLVGVVLAAGQSRRFGGDKRWADYRGRPLIAHALAVARSVCPRVLLVVDRPQAALAGLAEADATEVVVCPGAIGGLSASRGCALSRIVAEAERPAGLLFFLGDMPELPPDEARRVAWRMLDSGRPVRPVHAGSPGHPVAFPGRLLETLHAAGGKDLRAVFSLEEGDVLASSHPGVCRDVDLPSDLPETTG